MGGFFRQLVLWLPAGIALTDNCCSLLLVEGQSMWPTLNADSSWRDIVFVDKLSYKSWWRRYTRGDVAVLWAPDQPHQQLVKRLVALEGDTVYDKDRGKPLEIPKGRCWIEGDNADASGDSRNMYGPVHLGLLEGRVTYIVWPPWRVGPVRRMYTSDSLLVTATDSKEGQAPG